MIDLRLIVRVISRKTIVDNWSLTVFGLFLPLTLQGGSFSSELDSFYSDLASIESSQATTTEPGAISGQEMNCGEAATGLLPVESNGGSSTTRQVEKSVVSKATTGGGVEGGVVKKRPKKVKTSLSDIRDMSHLISKWQKAQQDL